MDERLRFVVRRLEDALRSSEITTKADGCFRPEAAIHQYRAIEWPPMTQRRLWPRTVNDTYENMWRSGSERIQSGAVECDKRIDDSGDSRLGLSVIFRLDSTISDRFAEFTQLARDVEPNLHTYSRSELHSTILSIVTCTENYRFDPDTQTDYESAISLCVDIREPLTVDFHGITASPSCVMAQGFPRGRSLDQLRNALRSTLRISGLHHTIDQRYKIHTAHVTLIRFKQPLVSPEELHDFISSYRSTTWGSQRVDQIHLVLNDWYHRSGRVRDLARFDLRAKGA